MLDMPKRWVAGQILHMAVVTAVHVSHEVRRVATIHRDGLSPKEQRFLDRQLTALDEANDNLAKLGRRLRKSSGEMMKHGG